MAYRRPTVTLPCLAAALVGCSGGLADVCARAAKPGTWHVTATLLAGIEGTPYGFPGPCPAVDLVVPVPMATADVQSSVHYTAATTEPGDRDRCTISYTQGSPENGGRTQCGGEFDGGDATSTAWAECFFEIGPANAYGDYSQLCRYTARWQRAD